MGYVVFKGSRVLLSFHWNETAPCLTFPGRIVGFLMTPPMAKNPTSSSCDHIPFVHAPAPYPVNCMLVPEPPLKWCGVRRNPCRRGSVLVGRLNYHELNEDQRIQRKAIIL